MPDEDAIDSPQQAVEYHPGELAPAIITQAQIWKPAEIEKIDKTILGALTDLVQTCSTTDEAARRFAVLQTWEARHMDRGYQYLEAGPNGGWNIVGTTGSKTQNGLATADDANLYATNVFSAQGDILTSALCRGQIKVKAAPVKSKDPSDSAASDEANKYIKLWEKNNESLELQRETVGLAWTDCRGIFWTRSIADKSRFGVIDDGTTPKYVEVTTLHGVLETKLPMMVDRLEQCGYAQVFEEMDYAVARAAYPWMGKKIKPSWGTYGELEFERIARINTRIGIVGKYVTGTSGIRETTVGYMWFRPGMYFDDKIEDKHREWLLTNFPDGLFLVMAGKDVVMCWNESMDDHLVLGMYTRGFGQNRRSLGSSDIAIQKRINIWADLWDKFVRTAIPITLLESMAFNDEAVAELESSPRRFMPVALGEGQAMDSVVGQTPAPVPIPGMAEMFQWYVGPLIQSIDGATPALFGSGEGEDNTVGATQIRLQQALERIGTAWIVANKMFAKAAQQAAYSCAENGNTELYDTVPGYGDVEVDPASLKGQFQVNSETIGSIPESGAQREAKILQILDFAQTSQQVAALVATPSNAKEIIDGLGMGDVLTIDEANWEKCALQDIAILLASEPLENPEFHDLTEQYQQINQAHETAKSLASTAVQSGIQLAPEEIQQGAQMEQQVGDLKQQLDQTPQYLPSVPVAQDDSEDHETMAATVFGWMGSQEGYTIRRASEKEPLGGENWKKWTNAQLYWQGHKEMAAKLAANNQQPIPPKISISIPVDKIGGAAAAQALQKAGIQASAEDVGGGGEQQQEVKQLTPMGEIKQKIKRRL